MNYRRQLERIQRERDALSPYKVEWMNTALRRMVDMGIPISKAKATIKIMRKAQRARQIKERQVRFLNSRLQEQQLASQKTHSQTLDSDSTARQHSE